VKVLKAFLYSEDIAPMLLLYLCQNPAEVVINTY